MSAAILSIGTELTRGEIVNTNASWLAESLTALGMEVTAMEVVADHRATIVETLHRLSASHTLLVCTGGLGPTTDDITSECVAEVLGVPMQRDDASLVAIKQRMARFGRSMAPSNEKQADFPRGATVLANRKGTAPGFHVQVGHANAFFLPGVPREMKTMFEEHIAPEVPPLVGESLHQVRLKTFGMTESAVNDKLAGIEGAHDVVIAYRAHFPEIEVKVLARAARKEDAESRARAAANVVLERLGPDVVYAEGDVTFAQALGALLLERNMKLATAESCTGGLVGEILTERGGSSEFYAGGIVAYENSVKEQLLGVPAPMLAQYGAVSPEVARAMAEGALRVVGANVAVAFTGIAGPGGGTPEKPVGTVCYAVATRDGTVDRQMVFPGSRTQVRQLAAFAGLALVRSVLRRGLDA